MKSTEIITLLKKYTTYKDEENLYKKQIIDFINTNDIFLGKENSKGHLTGSAWIVNTERDKVLLTHHNKLDKWLQLGGHSEIDEDISITALREAKEESGLSSLKFLSKEIFDIDVHKIPDRAKEPEHFHYDIRFIFEANENEEITVTNESKALKWIPLHEIHLFSQEISIKRMVDKTNKL